MKSISEILRPEILDFNKDQLSYWLKNDVENSLFNLQQISEEFADYLLFIKDRKYKFFLEVGAGDGGSSCIASYFLKDSLCSVDVVDIKRFDLENASLVYKLSYLKTELNLNISYFSSFSDIFFLYCKKKYDLIFIDGYHKYDFVRRDFINAKKFITENGIIVLHDIKHEGDLGVVKFWEEIKNNNCVEFVGKDRKLGIGVWQK